MIVMREILNAKQTQPHTEQDQIGRDLAAPLHAAMSVSARCAQAERIKPDDFIGDESQNLRVGC